MARGQMVPILEDTAIREADRRRVEALRQRRSLGSRLLLALVLLGPGMLVMIGDNDAGGVLTYAQTGASFGLGFYLPFLVVLTPVAYLVQEMTVRLGAVTGRGHAEMIWRRYGPFWGWFSLIDLVLANVLTLITEFIGIATGMRVLGVPPLLSIPAALALVSGLILGLRYYTWERAALWIATGNLVFVPLALMVHPHWPAVASSFLTWRVAGGFSPTFLYVLIANIGTTIAPWMLFFQQSCVVDKGLTPEDIPHGKLDTALGSAVMGLVALAIVVASATALPHGAGKTVALPEILKALAWRVGGIGVRLFALGLVEAGTIAAIAIVGSTSWAVGEAFDWPKSINLPPREAWKFYLPGLASAVLAASVVLLPHAPLGFLNLTVQVIATIFMPSALLFLLMLLNDQEIMGDFVNRPMQNVLAAAVVLLLVLVNGLYGLTIVFPHLL